MYLSQTNGSMREPFFSTDCDVYLSKMADSIRTGRYSVNEVVDIFADSDSENDYFQLNLSDSDEESSCSSERNDFDSQEASSDDSNNEQSSVEVDSDIDMLSADKVCILSFKVLQVL